MKLKLLSSKNFRIGVICGGSSSERKISIRSGRAVFVALQGAGYPVYLLDPSNKNFLNCLRKIDVAFLALHGAGGEDGQIQKLLTKEKIPFIGSDVKASCLAFDKVKTKRILIKHKIPTAPFIIIKQNSNWLGKLEMFGCPCFIKPPKEGSSIGVLAVNSFDKLTIKKISESLNRYKELLVERTLSGNEYTVGILSEKALPVVEMKPKAKFYDFHAKYTSGMTDYIVPAQIPATFAKMMQKMALSTHRALGLRDLSRVDIKTDSQGAPFVLEANTIPGFTEFSLLPKAAKAAGLSFENLCEKLVFMALKRGKIQIGKKI